MRGPLLAAAGFVLAAGLAIARPSPYLDGTASFWQDVQTVHNALERSHRPTHGASRPFFESMSNMFSDAEKAAFDRIHSGELPETGLDVADDIPTKLPVSLRMCDVAEEPVMATPTLHVDSLAVTLDLKHIKAKIELGAILDAPIASSLTHHTVVTVDDVSVGGFAMSPMVLYDLTGNVCELYGNVLGCPLAQGKLNLEKKVKVPGLDAISSLPRRLYNAQVKLYNDNRLVSCVHLYLDLRPDDAKAAKANPGSARIGVAPVKAPETTTASPTPEPQAVPPPVVDVQANVSSAASAVEPVTAPAAIGPLSVFPTAVTTAFSNLRTSVSGGDAAQPPSPPVLDPPNDAVKINANTAEDETAILQQLQLKNLQEQLDKQMEVNRQQQMKYDTLEKSLHGLDTSEIDNLKKTVNELIKAQKEEQEHIQHQKQTVEKEQHLYSQISQMYGQYKLPAYQLPLVASPFPGLTGPFPAQPSAPAQHHHAPPAGVFAQMPKPQPRQQPQQQMQLFGPGLSDSLRAANQPMNNLFAPTLMQPKIVGPLMGPQAFGQQQQPRLQLQPQPQHQPALTASRASAIGKTELMQQAAAAIPPPAAEAPSAGAAPALEPPAAAQPAIQPAHTDKSPGQLFEEAEQALLSPMATASAMAAHPSASMANAGSDLYNLMHKGMEATEEKVLLAKEGVMSKINSFVGTTQQQPALQAVDATVPPTLHA